MSSGRELEAKWSRTLPVDLRTLAFTLSKMKSPWSAILEQASLPEPFWPELRPGAQGNAKEGRKDGGSYEAGHYRHGKD